MYTANLSEEQFPFISQVIVVDRRFIDLCHNMPAAVILSLTNQCHQLPTGWARITMSETEWAELTGLTPKEVRQALKTLDTLKSPKGNHIWQKLSDKRTKTTSYRIIYTALAECFQ